MEALYAHCVYYTNGYLLVLYVTVYIWIRVAVYTPTSELELAFYIVLLTCISCYSEYRRDADILFYGNISFVVIQTFCEYCTEVKVIRPTHFIATRVRYLNEVNATIMV